MPAHTISRPPHWTRALAVVLALAPFVALWLQSSHRLIDHSSGRVVLVPIGDHAPASTAATAVAAPATSAKHRQPRPRAAVPSTATTEARPVEEEHQEKQGSIIHEANLPPSAAPASAPLNLEPSVVRSAVRASKSEVRKLAEGSGAYTGDQAKPKTEELAGAVAHSAKHDCLAPNESGSLLSVFIIAYQAANGACK